LQAWFLPEQACSGQKAWFRLHAWFRLQAGSGLWIGSGLQIWFRLHPWIELPAWFHLILNWQDHWASAICRMGLWLQHPAKEQYHHA
jgi:hypothetical protein